MRLVVLRNFALLAGLDPRELYDWFLKTNLDGCECATTTNVLCLSQYADGGKVAMKPYVSSAGFINTMSDYCGKCHYNPRNKTGKSLLVQFPVLELHQEPGGVPRKELPANDTAQGMGKDRALTAGNNERGGQSVFKFH
jgi:hypothetical protein